MRCFFYNSLYKLEEFYSQDNNLVSCNDICSVIKALGHQHDPEWCWFTDSSKVSLKAVLLCNRNKFPSVLLAHAASMKQSYGNMKLLLEKIHYNIFVTIYRSLLSCLACNLVTQVFLLLCKWNTRDRKHPYNQKQWPKWESLIPGQKNVVNTPLTNPEKVYLPLLHSNLGLIKNSSRQRVKTTLE
jgi:hypothetical protein